MTAFLDTQYLLAVNLRTDQWHSRAARMPPVETGVTTDAVLVEVADGLCNRSRALAVRILDGLRADPAVRVVPLESGLFSRAYDLYRSRGDKEWSLTDCISFVVMQDEGLQDALTADRHFEQAGFRALLREPPGR